MIAGRLRRALSVQRQGSTKNSRGEFTDAWTELANRRGAVRPLVGKEFWSGSGEHSEVTTEIRFRYDATVGAMRPKDRIVDAATSPNTVYDVQSVLNVREGGRELVVMCARLNP